MQKFLWNFLVFFLFLRYAYSLQIEDQLETQIDPRLPISFRQDNPVDILQVRQNAFYSIKYWSNGMERFEEIRNWEVYVRDYWYETRLNNMTCPQLPSGIATYCDWALMIPCLFGDVTKPPKSVYVHTEMLPHFVESTFNFLPNKSWQFILISGGSDRTIPLGYLDNRFTHGLRGFGNRKDNNYFERLMSSPQIVHWFAENRDTTVYENKFSSLPTGILGYSVDLDNHSRPLTPLSERPLMFFSGSRIRGGSQWKEREDVLEMCKKSSHCHYQGETDHNNYVSIIREFPFILCPHGGGVDPSPKAFESIYLGIIPVIRWTSFIEDSYSNLPVVFIDSWNDIFSPNLSDSDVDQIMKTWIDKLSPYFVEGSYLRNLTLHKLSTEYWAGKMLSALTDNNYGHASNISVRGTRVMI